MLWGYREELRADLSLTCQGTKITTWKSTCIANKFQSQMKPLISDHSPNMLLTFLLRMAPCAPGRGSSIRKVSTLQVPRGRAWGPQDPHPKGKSRVRAPPAQCGRPLTEATTHRVPPARGPTLGTKASPGGQKGTEGQRYSKLWTTHEHCFCHFPPACSTSLLCQTDAVNENQEGSGFGENIFKNVVSPQFKMFLGLRLKRHIYFFFLTSSGTP